MARGLFPTFLFVAKCLRSTYSMPAVILVTRETAPEKRRVLPAECLLNAGRPT